MDSPPSALTLRRSQVRVLNLPLLENELPDMPVEHVEKIRSNDFYLKLDDFSPLSGWNFALILRECIACRDPALICFPSHKANLQTA